MELSIPAKKSNLQIQKVKSLQYLTVRKVHYYTVNLAYIFEFSRFSYCSCKKFQGCCFANGEENYCYICQFKVKYNWIKIEKTSNTLRIEKNDKSMKESLKECIKCDPTLDQFWLYHFKVAWRERDGTTHQAFLYEFDEFFF